MSEGRPLRKVGDVLARLTRDLGLEGTHQTAAVLGVWDETVGPEIAAHAEPLRVRDGVLFVRVDSPGWGTQLRYLATSLAAGVNAAAGHELVREIKVVVGRQ